ncbi:IclR family transcriptional regulator [Pseudarthrobacter oxydans]|uniref:IclR family transcriptional regulator n=1 Tax=Pseudarthrobacter oxydans TaxID=1671 RepID=UPI00344BE4BC
MTSRNLAADAVGVSQPDAAPPGAIDRALELFAIIAYAGEPLSLAEAASQAGLSKPTTHRILKILVARGLLRQDQNRMYRLGARAYALATATLSHIELAREAQIGLDWLQTVTPEAIHFAALVGDTVVYVAKTEGTRPYRMASAVGSQLPVHSTAIGKVLLAFLPPERADRILPDVLVRFTDATITDVSELKSQFPEIRAKGYAIDDEENEENIRCIGAPVFGPANEVVGGVSVSAPSFILSRSEAQALAPSVVAAAEKISKAIGAPLSNA